MQDPFFGVGSDILSPRKIGSPLAENVELGAQCFATMQTPAENFLISCGNWENSFQVISLSDGRMVQSIRQHKDVVSCVAGIFLLKECPKSADKRNVKLDFICTKFSWYS